jgi:hypothetical protein
VVVTNGTGSDLKSCADASGELVFCGRYEEDNPDQNYFDGVSGMLNVPESHPELVRQKVSEPRAAG